MKRLVYIRTGMRSSEQNIFNRALLSRTTYLVVRLILAAIFIYAGSVKLLDPKAFARVISHWELVPDVLLPVVAIGLPALEVLAGGALIFDLRIGLYAITGMIVMFIIIIGYGMVLGLDVDCGCFGAQDVQERQGLHYVFYRDLVLLGPIIFLYWSRFMRGRKLYEAVSEEF